MSDQRLHLGFDAKGKKLGAAFSRRAVRFRLEAAAVAALAAKGWLASLIRTDTWLQVLVCVRERDADRDGGGDGDGGRDRKRHA